MNTILAIDTDLTVHEQQTAAWGKIGIGTSRVETMNEAISRLSRGETFLFIAINEDSIPDYIPQLPLMRDVTNLPIFIITSNYTTSKKVAAIQSGADVYDPFSNFVKENVFGALELLKLQKRWAELPKEPSAVLIGGDIILSPLRRIVFVKDIEVSLRKKEFDILYHLIANKGQFLTHKQLLYKVWGDEYSENGNDILWKTIYRLRSKLSKASMGKEYIKAERETGYKFTD